MFKFIREFFRTKETLLVGVVSFYYKVYPDIWFRSQGIEKTMTILLYEKEDGKRYYDFKYEDRMPYIYESCTICKLIEDWTEYKIVAKLIPSYASVKDGCPVAHMDYTDNLGIF